MTEKAVTVIQLPEEVQKVPTDRSGVYFFSLVFPSNYELGLIEPTSFDKSKLLILVEKALSVVKLVLSDRELKGFLQTYSDALHLRVRYQMNAESSSQVSIGSLLNDCFNNVSSFQEACALVESLRLFIALTPPIYIGMTVKQSFYDRLNQHLSGDTDFSERVKNVGLSWSDLRFGYHNINSSDPIYVRNIEKVGQHICFPALSRV